MKMMLTLKHCWQITMLVDYEWVKNMEWNVYYYNINKNKIETYNIFNHYNFNKDVIRDLNQFRNRNAFANALKSNLRYYFWSKCEWEVLVYPWPVGHNDKPIKIDVYDQVMLNWESFVDYCWTQ